MHIIGVGMGLGFTGTAATKACAGYGTGENSSEGMSATSGRPKVQRRMGWMRRGSIRQKENSKEEEGEEEEEDDPSLRPLPLFTRPAPQPSQPALSPSATTNYGRRRPELWKGKVKGCTVIAGELREQVAQDIAEENQKARKQMPEKRNESMDWREALESFRVP